STVATQLNWGASYLVNDFYKRFMRSDADEKHYVNVSRLTTVLLFFASCGVTAMLSSVEQAWKFIIGLGAGSGMVYILRWYWWRINAWSEVSAMIASFVTFCFASGALGDILVKVGVAGGAAIIPAYVSSKSADADAIALLITVGVTTIVWLTTTFMTK